MKKKTKIIVHSSNIKDGFYSQFLNELPTFTVDDTVASVVGECIRAAKRAEMRVLEKERN